MPVYSPCPVPRDRTRCGMPRGEASPPYCGNDCIWVFSFTGDLLRTIRGEWRRPAKIICVHGRIYLVSSEEGERPRVFVLTTAGAALQTYVPELGAGLSCWDMAVLGDNLVLSIVSLSDFDRTSVVRTLRPYSVSFMALKGL